MFGALRALQTVHTSTRLANAAKKRLWDLTLPQRLGRDAFPVIPQTLYSSHLDMLITPEFPLVAKVGHAHAGMCSV